MKKYGILFFLVLQLSTPAYSQEATPSDDIEKSPEESIIENVRLEGLEYNEPEFILSNIDLIPGDKLDLTQIQSNFTRLLELDLFENIIIKIEDGKTKNAKVVIFEFEELPFIAGVVIEGPSDIDPLDIAKVMNLRKDTVYRDSYLEIDRQTISNLYLESGYANVRVHISANGGDDGPVNILVHIEEGLPSYIHKVRVIGTKHIDPEAITDFIKTRESKFYSKEILNEMTLDEDKNIIQAYAQSLGFYHARVKDIKVLQEPIFQNVANAPRKFGLTVLIEIEEGDQFKLGKINLLEENQPIDKSKLISLKEGDIFNKLALEDNFKVIQSEYYNQGYIRVGLLPEYKVDEENNTVDVTVNIFPGEKAHIKDIFIVGNNRTQSYVIDREFAFFEGELFSYKKYYETIRRISRLNYFKSVNPELIEEEESDLVSLVFRVDEKGTGSILLGGSIDGSKPLSAASFTFNERLVEKNLFGSGWGVYESFEYGVKKLKVSVGTFTNWLLPYVPVQFSFNVNYLDTDIDVYQRMKKEIRKKSIDYEYSLKSFSFEVSFGYDFGNYWSVQSGLDLYFSRAVDATFKLEDLNTSLSWVKYLKDDLEFEKNNNRFHQRFSHHFSVSYDSTDSTVVPTKGIKANLRLTYTGGIYTGDSQWIKLNNSYSFYFNPFWKVVFSYSLAYEMLFEQFDGQFKLREIEQLRFNGITQLRGWARKEKDVIISTGGKISFSQEVKFPFLGDILWGSLFLDMGDVSDTRPSLPSKIRYFSYGFGIQLHYNLFPVVIYFAKKVDYDVTQRRQLTFHPGYEIVFFVGGSF